MPIPAYRRCINHLGFGTFALDHPQWLELIEQAHSYVDQVRAEKGLGKWDWRSLKDGRQNPVELRKRGKRKKMRSIAIQSGN